jgi:hypothetical protein
MTTLRLSIVGALLSVFLCGCGSPTGTLTGTVRYKGAALPGGSLIVYCEDEQILAGAIREDGSYTIAGLPEGRVVVTVVTLPRVPEGMQLKQNLPPTTSDGPRAPSEGVYAKGRHVVLPRRYATREESGLSAVVARGTQVFDIDLKP